jgi:beta-lactamase superfamily II metal-dependent hydrolase
MRVTLISPDVAGLKKLAASWKKQIQLVNAQSSVAARWKKEKRYSQIASMLLGGPNINSLLRTPVRGDKSVANGSSIAFIGEYEGKSCLFAGDAHSEQLLRAIEPGLKAKGRDKLSVNAWKLAHHGSKKSNLDQLMQKISTANMLISSDGSRYKHPDPECIARLITYNGPGLSFHFNYCSKRNETWKDVSLQRKHSFKAFYPKGDHGISVVI